MNLKNVNHEGITEARSDFIKSLEHLKSIERSIEFGSNPPMRDYVKALWDLSCATIALHSRLSVAFFQEELGGEDGE